MVALVSNKLEKTNSNRKGHAGVFDKADSIRVVQESLQAVKGYILNPRAKKGEGNILQREPTPPGEPRRMSGNVRRPSTNLLMPKTVSETNITKEVRCPSNKNPDEQLSQDAIKGENTTLPKSKFNEYSSYKQSIIRPSPETCGGGCSNTASSKGPSNGTPKALQQQQFDSPNLPQKTNPKMQEKLIPGKGSSGTRTEIPIPTKQTKQMEVSNEGEESTTSNSSHGMRDANSKAEKHGSMKLSSWKAFSAPNRGHAHNLNGDQKETCTSGDSEARTFRHEIPLLLPSYGWVDRQQRAYQGPTTESNWVLPGKLMVGAYPSSNDDPTNQKILYSMLALGITTFVCLQDEYIHEGVSERMWRSEGYLRPYIFDALELTKECCDQRSSTPSESGFEKSDSEIRAPEKTQKVQGFRKATRNHTRNREGMKAKHALPRASIVSQPVIVKPHDLKFLHVPIVDCACTTDQVVLDLAQELCWRLVCGEVLYVHCWGGHGRTGTVVAVMLAIMYGLDCEEALARVQYYHDLRRAKLTVRSPQTESQRNQVRRIINRCHETATKDSGSKYKILVHHTLKIPVNAIQAKRFQLKIHDPNSAQSASKSKVSFPSVRSKKQTKSEKSGSNSQEPTNRKPNGSGIQNHKVSSQAKEKVHISHGKQHVPKAPEAAKGMKLWDRQTHGYRYHRISQNRTHAKRHQRKNLGSQDLNRNVIANGEGLSAASSQTKEDTIPNANTGHDLEYRWKATSNGQPGGSCPKENSSRKTENATLPSGSHTSRMFHKARKLVITPPNGDDAVNVEKELTVRIGSVGPLSPKEYLHKQHRIQNKNLPEQRHQGGAESDENYVRPIKPPVPNKNTADSGRSIHMNLR